MKRIPAHEYHPANCNFEEIIFILVIVIVVFEFEVIDRLIADGAIESVDDQQHHR